ncbi:uncharacterized protein [Apostichopus japonicus]|uniref:uncharacterized protein isoform X2 n=1 Tax=Stichopus japonicus TaxID=307972 RepID=UPI003AB6B91E
MVSDDVQPPLLWRPVESYSCVRLTFLWRLIRFYEVFNLWRPLEDHEEIEQHLVNRPKFQFFQSRHQFKDGAINRPHTLGHTPLRFYSSGQTSRAIVRGHGPPLGRCASVVLESENSSFFMEASL